MNSLNTLPAKERLKTTSQFQAVFNHGKKEKGKLLDLYYMPNSLQYNRIGIVVSSKNIAKANKRNRIKRFIKEAYRNNKDAFGLGLDLVMINRARDTAKSCSEYIQDVLGIARRIKRI